MSTVTPLEHTAIGAASGIVEVCIMQPTGGAAAGAGWRAGSCSECLCQWLARKQRAQLARQAQEARSPTCLQPNPPDTMHALACLLAVAIKNALQVRGPTVRMPSVCAPWLSIRRHLQLRACAESAPLSHHTATLLFACRRGDLYHAAYLRFTAGWG